jgi:transposase
MSKKTHVSHVDFVIACRDCATAKEVAERLSMTLTNVYVRAKKMREEGIDLPEFNAQRTGRKRDVAALNALLAEKSEEKTDTDANEQAEKLLEEVTA